MAKLKAALTVFLMSHAKGGLAALLQGRGEISHEKVHFHSFPGTFQTTVFETGKEGEGPRDVLERGIVEELGPQVLLPRQSIVEVFDDKNDDRRIVFYAVFIPEAEVEAFLRSVSLNASTGGLRWIVREEVPRIEYVQPIHKMAGVSERVLTVMRQDEAQGVERSFAVIEAQLAAAAS